MYILLDSKVPVNVLYEYCKLCPKYHQNFINTRFTLNQTTCSYIVYYFYSIRVLYTLHCYIM